MTEQNLEGQTRCGPPGHVGEQGLEGAGGTGGADTKLDEGKVGRSLCRDNGLSPPRYGHGLANARKQPKSEELGGIFTGGQRSGHGAVREVTPNGCKLSDASGRGWTP